MRLLLLFFLLGSLLGCSANTEKPDSSGAGLNPAWPDPVGEVALILPDGPPAENALLDVGLVIFDPGIPEDAATHSKLGIFPSIRTAESRYLPYLLRESLVATEAWGAVRVLPRPDQSSELLVSGEILHSDGMLMAIHITARDATSRIWLDRVYVDESRERDYPVAPGEEPYIHLYRQIANDLLGFRQGLSVEQLPGIRNVGLLQYAASLSPDAFQGFLATAADGTLEASRLPARDDPMLGRVQRIKNQEYLFIDTADEQYQTLYDRMTPTYNLWRQNGRELAVYKVEYEERVASRDRDGRRGTFAAMQQTYNVYKRSKEHDQDLDELAEGFNNEVTPTVMEIEGKVFRLNGSLETQYNEWRSILRSIFILETGLPPVEE
jgi:hypothetical protein